MSIHAAAEHQTSSESSEVTSAQRLADGQAHTPPSLAAWTGMACNATHAWKGITCEGGRLTALNLSRLNLEGKECAAYTIASVRRYASMPPFFALEQITVLWLVQRSP